MPVNAQQTPCIHHFAPILAPSPIVFSHHEFIVSLNFQEKKMSMRTLGVPKSGEKELNPAFRNALSFASP